MRLHVGVVVIGRNEGDRLRCCLDSVADKVACVVYVDSGSHDDSVEIAQTKGAVVKNLEMKIPFTAARARNAGLELLRSLHPELIYVQFVDGDCEVVEGWLKQAVGYLDQHSHVAVVCGRRRERHPERSIYNQLCDFEWDTPIGEAKACGGDAMMRISAVAGVGGYRAGLIAGEEPELCIRLRAAGHKIWRLDAEMTLHDAGMTRFGQWWKRTMRSGYSFAEGAFLHGASKERHWVRESRRAWFWVVGIPLLISIVVFASGVWGFILLTIYPLQVFRIAMRGERSPKENWLEAVFLVLGKFPEVAGQLRFLIHRLGGKKGILIEYK